MRAKFFPPIPLSHSCSLLSSACVSCSPFELFSLVAVIVFVSQIVIFICTYISCLYLYLYLFFRSLSAHSCIALASVWDAGAYHIIARAAVRGATPLCVLLTDEVTISGACALVCVRSRCRQIKRDYCQIDISDCLFSNKLWNSIALSPSDYMFYGLSTRPAASHPLAGWSDGRIRAFDAATGEALWHINDAHAGGVTTITLSPNTVWAGGGRWI